MSTISNKDERSGCDLTFSLCGHGENNIVAEVIKSKITIKSDKNNDEKFGE